MSTTDKILRQIEKGGTLDELAKESDMRKSILVVRIDFLANQLQWPTPVLDHLTALVT